MQDTIQQLTYKEAGVMWPRLESVTITTAGYHTNKKDIANVIRYSMLYHINFVLNWIGRTD